MSILKPPPSINPSALLSQSYTERLKLIGTTTENIANVGVRGAAKIQSSLSPLGSLGAFATTPQVTIDPTLARELRDYNGDQAYWKIIKDGYENFLNQFGTKESLQSVDRLCQGTANSLLAMATSASSDKRTAFVAELQTSLARFNTIQTSITTARNNTEQAKQNIVNDVNDLLQKINTLNTPNRSAQEETNLNTHLFDLGQLMSITVEQGKGAEAGFFTLKMGNTNGGRSTLVQRGGIVQFLSYAPTLNSSPGTSPGTIMLNGVNVEPEISTGALAGQIQANTNLINIQTALDHFATTFRNTLNETHNLGSSLSCPSTLTGSVGILGSEGTPLTGTDVISGQGTWRIAIIDPATQKVMDYKDIALQQNETINNFITRINNAAYNTNTGDTFTASLTANGQFQIQSTNNTYGIAVGSVGQTDAKINTGAAFNTTQATNVSHFFHLNDLISVPSPTTMGLFGNMQVNSPLITNPQRLCGAKLTSAAQAETYGIADKPGPGDNVFSLMNQALSSQKTFSAAGDIGPQITSLLGYSSLLTTTYASKQNSALSHFKTSDINLKLKQSEFHTQAGINFQEERLKLAELSKQIRGTNSALIKMQELQELPLKLLERS